MNLHNLKAGEKMTKRYNILLIIFIILIACNASFVYASYPSPEISAPNAILIDYTTGKVLYEKNAHKSAYPASTTKVMTAILVLENADLNEVITITEDLYVDGASMYLLKGESFSVGELLKVLLIRSANDVAEVLAKHVSGSIEAFANLMNKRARELGALNTNFTNPHGLPDENHLTTAYDLALIAKHGMSFDLFREIVSTSRLTIEATEFTPENRYYRNSNKFLWATGASNQIHYDGKYINIKYDIVDGIKTGYTSDAQHCLISSSYAGDHRLIAVVLGSQGPNLYSDSRRLIDYGYDNFQLIQLADKSSFKTTAILKNAVEENIFLYIDESLNTTLSKNFDINDLNEEIIIYEDIKAPISPGDVLGMLVYSVGDQVVATSDLISKDMIARKTLLQKVKIPSNIFLKILLVFLLWQILVIYLRVKKGRIRRKTSSQYASSYKFSKNLLKSSSYRKR